MTTFDLTKAPGAYVREPVIFETYDNEQRIPTPAAATDGYTGAIANVYGIDKGLIEVQTKLPAEYALFSCGVSAPAEVMLGYIKKLPPCASKPGNWEMPKVAYEALCHPQRLQESALRTQGCQGSRRGRRD